MRGVLTIVFAASCFALQISAQDLKRDARAISLIKKIQVSKLDNRLPDQTFTRWFRKVLGSTQKIDWELNDCGEQDGSGRQKEFPICVQAAGQTADLIQISVSIVVGTHKRGIVGKPSVWGIWIEAKPNTSKILDALNELPQEIRGMRRQKND